VNATNANRIDILFISCVSLPETSVEQSTRISGGVFDASDARIVIAARFATQPYPAPKDVQTHPLKKGNVAREPPPGRTEFAEDAD
jgi:hypothetical protein